MRSALCSATAVGAVLAKAALGPGALDFAFFGLPAYGEDSALLGTLSRLPQQFLRADAYLCGNDMVCGWAGSLLVPRWNQHRRGHRLHLLRRAQRRRRALRRLGRIVQRRGIRLLDRLPRPEPVLAHERRPAARGALYEIVKHSLGIGEDLDLCAHVFSRLAAIGRASRN